MPKIQNTFIKSKMNKDLDDRLLSNGEYRNAQNVNISRSEGEDVGSLENVLGNKIASELMASVQQELLGFGVVVIGFFEDDTNKCVYTFLTNYSDPFLGQQTQAPYGSEHYIVKTDLKNITDPSYLNSQILVKGNFLNFSQTNPIYGVNLIEDLLFWTDNRNQPRKINVKLATSVLDPGSFEPPYPGGYYTSEDQISVAKYYPLHTPKIFDQVSINVIRTSTADAVTGDFKNFVTIADAKKLRGGMMMLRGSGSTPAYPAEASERFIIGVFVGTNTTSYFLTNRSTIGPSETNKIVDFGYSTAVKATGEFMDYSITGSVFRENANLDVTQGPLKQQTITGIPTYPSTSAKFTQGWFGTPVPPGDYVAAGYSLYNSTNGFTNANVNLKIINGSGSSGDVSRVTEITVTMGGSSGGDGFEVGSILQFNYSQLPVPGGAGGGFIRWTLDANDLASIEIPTAKTFYWSGSSIPYTKMKVDVPGYVSGAPYPRSNTITASEFVGKFILSATRSINYYKITTLYNHNIGVSTVLNAIAIAEFSWPNPDYLQENADAAFPGDPEYLKNRFVRFAYRFKFDDGEYSLISPFTQPVFVPKQRGFIQDGVSLVGLNAPVGTAPGTSTTGNVPSSNFQRYATGEEDIQASTIVSFFENNIDTVRLQIETPYPVSGLDVTMKITEIDIIYKESDAQDMKVLDTIPYEVFKYESDQTTLNDTNVFEYLYESKEPFKLVKPAKELVRVYDKVPVKAFAQETSGGRIIYGNFLDKHTPLSSLKFNVRVTQKTAPVTKNITTPSATQDGVVGSSSYLSYPTHTLKQNRTYQVGFVLSDRYGRQSDVILAPVDTGQYYLGTIKYDGGTIFNPYFQNTSVQNIATWRGENLEILLREAIPETVTYADGYPGLYNSGEYVMNVASNLSGSIITFTSIDPRIKVGDIFTPISNNVVSTVTSVVIAINLSINQITFNNSVTVAPNTTTGNVLINNTGKINGDSNVLGWYSYKVVVKQLTEDYYNAYLGNLAYVSPSAALNSNFGNYPFSGSSFVTSLLSDNTNKIAADLTKVAPEQLQFGTSDTLLYPRVGGTILKDAADPYVYATNFAFGTETASINAYGKIKDLGVAELNSGGTAFKTPTQSRGVQAAVSDPTSILLSMPNGQQIGREYWKPSGLYILEVGALESKIEIFWETSTSGLISDLNASFLEGPTPAIAQPGPNPNPVPPTDGNTAVQ